MPFTVYVVDHVGWLPAGSWSAQRREAVCQSAAVAFNQLTTHQSVPAQFIPFIVTASGGTPQPNEPVIHLVRDVDQSIIAARGGNLEPGHGGNTMWIGNEMVSEVYVRLSDAQGVANLIVHETMHNKLDAHPRRLVNDIHRFRPPGYHSYPIVPQWTPENSREMLRGLRNAIPQHYDASHGVMAPQP
ncbi:MAG: hypothetical protein R3C53_00780 [Pirellulaceae bacterium]